MRGVCGTAGVTLRDDKSERILGRAVLVLSVGIPRVADVGLWRAVCRAQTAVVRPQQRDGLAPQPSARPRALMPELFEIAHRELALTPIKTKHDEHADFHL